MALLWSKEGCQRQLPHADYSYSVLQEARRDHGMTESTPPLSAVLALQDCTLDIWPGALILKKKDPLKAPVERKLVQLKQGQLLIFRGDLIHAGSAYASSNFRLHFYLDYPGCSRVANSTEYADVNKGARSKFVAIKN